MSQQPLNDDEGWQERAARGALGASLGGLAGANLRQLGRVGAASRVERALGDEVDERRRAEADEGAGRDVAGVVEPDEDPGEGDGESRHEEADADAAAHEEDGERDGEGRAGVVARERRVRRRRHEEYVGIAGVAELEKDALREVAKGKV